MIPSESNVCLALASSTPPRKIPGAISDGRRVLAVSNTARALSESRETRAQSSYRSTTSRPDVRCCSVTSRKAHSKFVFTKFEVASVASVVSGSGCFEILGERLADQSASIERNLAFSRLASVDHERSHSSTSEDARASR